MKKIRFNTLAALAAMALLCCSAMFISAGVRAQCPDCPCPLAPIDDAQYDTTPIPWHTADTCAIIAVDTFQPPDYCMVHICYIYRQTSATNYDYCVTATCVDPNCNYDPTDSTVLDSASWFLMQTNPQHFPSDVCLDTDLTNGGCSKTATGPPCCGTNIQWNEDFITCWADCPNQAKQKGSLPQGTGHMVYCADHGWCIDAYYVCKDRTTGKLKFCYDRSVATTWQCTPGGQPGPCPPYTCSPVFPNNGCPSYMGH